MLHIGDKPHMRSQDDEKDYQKKISQSPHLRGNFKSHRRERKCNTCYESTYFHRKSEVMKQSCYQHTPSNREEEKKFLGFGDVTDKTRKYIDPYQYGSGNQNKSFEHRNREGSENMSLHSS